MRWYQNHDLSLFKNFPIGGHKKAQFRFSASNVFNHPQRQPDDIELMPRLVGDHFQRFGVRCRGPVGRAEVIESNVSQTPMILAFDRVRSLARPSG